MGPAASDRGAFTKLTQFALADAAICIGVAQRGAGRIGGDGVKFVGIA